MKHLNLFNTRRKVVGSARGRLLRDLRQDAVLSAPGSVTSVGSGTGLSGGPITSTGTLSLANTAVTAGSYSFVNITVDAQGRITAASVSSISKSGATQAAAGAATGEFWVTASHATLPDGVVMQGL